MRLRAKRVCVRRARVTCFPLCAQTALRFPPARRPALEGRIMAYSRLRSRWGWAERVFRSAHGGEGPILHPRPHGPAMRASSTSPAWPAWPAWQGMPSLFALPCNALHGSRCLVVWQWMAIRAPTRGTPTIVVSHCPAAPALPCPVKRRCPDRGDVQSAASAPQQCDPLPSSTDLI